MITIAEALIIGAICLIFGALFGATLTCAMVVAKDSDEGGVEDVD